MGRIHLRSKQKSLCASRKNRRLALLRAIKHKGKENIHPEVSEFATLVEPQHTNAVLLEPQAGCSTMLDLHMDTIIESTEQNYDFTLLHDHNYHQIHSVSDEIPLHTDHDYCLNIDKDMNKVESSTVSGRRIFDVQHLFRQILNSKKHIPFDCSIIDMEIVKEQRKGLHSKFQLKCKMCNIYETISTDDYDDETQLNINKAVTLSAISTGVGYSQVAEMAAAINMPMMTKATFITNHEAVSAVVLSTAWKVMEDAAREEATKAKELNEVDKHGVPCITVVTDGAWGKRSYNVNYDSSSGVACIIGHRTGKLLYLGVRNKYCSVCAKYENSSLEVPSHNCYKNWHASSTAMEADIILEGFKLSIQMHGLKYTKMIGDGDSSVYRKLLESKPYGNQLVEKIECKNHLLRNFSSKLREICNRRRSNSKNILVPPYLRKEVANRSRRLRTAITQAIRYRMNEETNHSEKLVQVENDLKNAPSHVFGEHAKCAEISYFNCDPKETETNLVLSMAECGLYQDVQSCLQRLINNSTSLLLNMDNNMAEHFNSIVCKFVGGKRVNFSLRGSYKTRCEAAAVSFNTGGEYYRTMYKAFTGASPKKYTRKFIMNSKRRRQLRKKVFRRKKVLALPDHHYGPAANVILSFDDDAYIHKKDEFLEALKKTKQEIESIQKSTVGQSGNPQWIQERSVRLTASNFGRICKMRSTTSTANTVKYLLYNTFVGNKATRYGSENEPHAIKEFEKQLKLEVRSCGFFIDEEEYYLGASPDGLIGDDGIIEIKCPSVISKMTPTQGISEKKITFATIRDGNLILKRNHNYFYQVQGQLAITKRSWCYFCVWSPSEILIERIERDDLFWQEMIPPLKKFFFTALLPELIDPQFPKGLPIRETVTNKSHNNNKKRTHRHP